MTSRVALVTGGTRGIGAAVSSALKRAGFTVAANYARNEEAAKAFEQRTGIQVFRWDVGNSGECNSGVSAVKAALGPIDVLVNNAGVTRDQSMYRMNDDDWNSVITTNLSSAFFMTRAVIEEMRLRKFGRIVNISSIIGQKGARGQANYAAAKAGLYGLTKSAALECASHGITVNAVAPGYIDTDMLQAAPQPVLSKMLTEVPVARFGTADEVAHCVTFLASDEAGYITGSTLTINGGVYLT